MFCGNGNNCFWIIIILILLCSCGNGWGGSTCGNNCGCESVCGC